MDTAQRDTLPIDGSAPSRSRPTDDTQAVPAAPALPSLPASHYGRFVVLRTLGEGGMGVVLSAYDERLDRRVAIKVLRPGAQSEWRARVLREARALARLSHPNVVQVYEVGEQLGDLFIVMEHVDGQTLAQWRRQGPHGVAAVLERFMAAGRGLAAAHAAGLVHRDFKPGNVLLGHDGRVCVADFGIASVDPHQRSSSGSLDDPSRSEAGLTLTDEPLTQPNVVVGTPAYMAPEQMLGDVVDARSDQFSFCVALYETLLGERPFEGRALEELQRTLMAGRRRPLPRDHQVPAHVLAVLDRGLRPYPAERWPSMEHLLHALGDDPRRRRRRWILQATGLVALGAAAWGYRELVRGEYELARSARAQMCQDAATAWNAAWSDEPRERVRSAMLATERPFAEAAWHAVETRLDGYGEGWLAQHGQACEATIGGTQSEAMLDLRLACLATRRRAVAALVDELSRADATAVERAPKAAAGLPALEPCADLAALAGQGRPPASAPDPTARDALQEQLARVRARFELGRYAAGRGEAEDLVTKAQTVSDPQLVARARYELGRLQQRLGELAPASETLHAVFYEAEALGDDLLRLETAVQLTYLEGVERHDRAAGLAWGRQAQAVLARLGPAGEPQRSGVLHHIANVHGNHGEPELALPLLEEALDLRQAEPDGYPPARAGTLADLGLTHAALGQLERARERIGAAVDLLQGTLGPEHPELVPMLINLMSTHQALGEVETAVAVGERAVAVGRASLPPEHPILGKLLVNLAVVESDRGRHAEAKAYYREGLERLERAYGPDDPNLVIALASSAAEEGQHGDPDRSRALYERALAIATATQGPSHPSLVLPLQGLAHLDAKLGRVAPARERFTRAIEVQRQHPIPEALAPLLLSLAALELEDGRPEAAESLCRESNELVAAPEGPDGQEFLGAALQCLAQARRGQGDSLDAVAPLVQRAQAALQAAGPLGEARLAELRSWWREQGGPG